jgi:hypothetical protein
MRKRIAIGPTAVSREWISNQGTKSGEISRGEIEELAIGYISAMTHDFLAKALEVWRLNSPGIIVDCIEMDSISQERALLEGASL